MAENSLNIPNLDKLIAHLEAQPPERINMGFGIVMSQGDCGTCGCIAGHVMLLWPNIRLEWNSSAGDLVSALGASPLVAEALAYPRGYEEEQQGISRYPAHRVIATLKRLRDRFLATGEIVVDWGTEPTAGEPWAAPRVAEIPGWFEVIAPPDPPALPEAITRLLSAEPVTATEGC